VDKWLKKESMAGIKERRRRNRNEKGF